MSIPTKKELAKQAVELTKTMINSFAEEGIVEQVHGCLIVGVTSKCLSMTYFGDRSKWDRPHIKNARLMLMAASAWRRSMREMHEQLPDTASRLILSERGSAYNKEYKFVAAFCGLDEHMNEAIAEIALAIFVGLVRDAEIK